MLHGDGHDEAPEEHVVGGVEIVDGDLSCTHTTRYMSAADSDAAIPVDMTPSSGSSTIGIMEVMGRGRASVSQ